MSDTAFYAGIVVVVSLVIWFGVRYIGRRVYRAILMRRHKDAAMVDVIMSRQIAQGMTAAMVIDAWGKPADMDEKVMKTKTKSEMKYDQSGKNRFGTRVYLENGTVVGWETK